jgi:nucleotide-binding universal stress UspA family protein
VIAWDGNREAVRAVHDALPLLILSSTVQIVRVVTDALAEGSDTDARSLPDHLANHGIQVETDILQVSGVGEHETLRARIEQGNYDLLVMGAYSHPAWFNFLFGGATRSIASSSGIPVPVSH